MRPNHKCFLCGKKLLKARLGWVCPNDKRAWHQQRCKNYVAKKLKEQNEREAIKNS